MLTNIRTKVVSKEWMVKARVEKTNPSKFYYVQLWNTLCTFKSLMVPVPAHTPTSQTKVKPGQKLVYFTWSWVEKGQAGKTLTNFWDLLVGALLKTFQDTFKNLGFYRRKDTSSLPIALYLWEYTNNSVNLKFFRYNTQYDCDLASLANIASLVCVNKVWNLPYYSKGSITDRPVCLDLFLGVSGRGRVLGMVVGLGGVQTTLLGPSGGGPRGTLHQAHGHGHGHPGVATGPHNSHQIENPTFGVSLLVPSMAVPFGHIHFWEYLKLK